MVWKGGCDGCSTVSTPFQRSFQNRVPGLNHAVFLLTSMYGCDEWKRMGNDLRVRARDRGRKGSNLYCGDQIRTG